MISQLARVPSAPAQQVVEVQNFKTLGLMKATAVTGMMILLRLTDGQYFLLGLPYKVVTVKSGFC